VSAAGTTLELRVMPTTAVDDWVTCSEALDSI
jgi:hypothetical protein